MKKARRIYCIEGHHDWGKREIEPTVEPMLQLLRSTGYWEDYVHRKCVTVAECQFYLREEWSRCEVGSVLYFAAHGGPGEVWLSGAPGEQGCEVLSLDTLSAWEVDCTNCLVHFGCCSVFGEDKKTNGEAKVREFILRTDAAYASGYGVDVGWLDDPVPSLALELMFFGSVSQVDLGDGRRAKSMRATAHELSDQFDNCEFRLLDWWAVSRAP